MRARTRRLIRRLPAGVRRGADPVAIGPLVAPLRYDVVVRQKFFELARTMPDASVAEIADASPDYRTWFETIEVPRRPELSTDRRAVRAAYLDRVDRSLALLRRFLDDPRWSIEPVMLRFVADVPTDTGKRIPPMLQPADGCHRLALLRMAGATTLLPGDYRIERGLRPPTDNTSRLVSELSVPVPDYVEFVGTGYGAPGARRIDELIGFVRAHAPDRVAELEEIIEIDLGGQPSMTTH